MKDTNQQIHELKKQKLLGIRYTILIANIAISIFLIMIEERNRHLKCSEKRKIF